MTEYYPVIAVAAGTVIPAIASLITSREASIPWQTAINSTVAVLGAILMGFAGKLALVPDLITIAITLVSTLAFAKLVYRPTGVQHKLASLLPGGIGSPS
jgi:hypothetical protein